MITVEQYEGGVWRVEFKSRDGSYRYAWPGVEPVRAIEHAMRMEAADMAREKGM